MFRGLRRSEILAICFFLYTAAIAPFFSQRPGLHNQPLLLAVLVVALHLILATAERRGNTRFINYLRDWTPVLITLVAFQEMDLFGPGSFPHYWEPRWILQDQQILSTPLVRRILNGTGPVLPFYLETCYLLVYGIAAIAVGVLYRTGKRARVDEFYLFYLSATLGAYALFPFFPTEPPRFLYPGVSMPTAVTFMRTFNLFLLRKATIHVSVFPSAHVSSAFAAAWAILWLLAERKVIGTVFVIYAASVAVATVYGRYHYTADAVAGFLLSVLAFALCRWYLNADTSGQASLSRDTLP